MSTGRPISADELARGLGGMSSPQIITAIEDLDRRYTTERRPYRIIDRQGYRIELRPEYLSVALRLLGQAPRQRLSAAAVEVLALVAYGQPVSRKEIEDQRGRDSRGPLASLVRTGLVRTECGTSSGTVLYRTTDHFLDFFGLDGLKDLPRPGELDPPASNSLSY